MPEYKLHHAGLRRWRSILLATSTLALALPVTGPARAQDATWLATPGSAEYSTGANWDTGSVPTGTATFAASSTKSLTISTGGTVNVDAWAFNVGGYNIYNYDTLIFNGAGISGSASISNFGLDLRFYGTSTAGSAVITNSTLSSANFYNTSSAGSATITNQSGATLNFHDTATAGSASITNNGTLEFYDTSTAGSAAITNEASSAANFYNNSSAGNATITNKGGATLNFHDTATAGSATVTNQSGATLSFHNTATAGSANITSSGTLEFYGNSTAGNSTITSSSASSNFLRFWGNSTAGSATITNGNNSYLNFLGTSTAGSASLTNNFYMYFQDSSSADSATIANNQTLHFYSSSTGGNASITNNSGGTTYFNEHATAGNAQLINNAANAVFDFSRSTGPNDDNKLSAGSIAGNGTFSLGANELTVGGNNLSTTVTGVIADGGTNGGTGASLVKTGTGMLTLAGTNTYTGGTTFAGGTVSVSSDANLGDAAGGLTFNGGTLQITGTTFNATTRGITWGTGGGKFDIAAAANNFVVSQNLSGGALTKSGAGTLTLTGADTLSRVTVSDGKLVFGASATAGNTTITNYARLVFDNNATAGSATITSEQQLLFTASSSAGSATITNNNQLTFDTGATAGSALIMNVGRTLFDGNSTPGNAQLFNASSGSVFDLSMTTGPNGDNKLTAGSLLGSGTFNLGINELTVGSNNLSTNVTGVLADGGSGGGTGASLIKVGSGRLTLSGVNTYTGATTVNGGTLAANGDLTATSGITVNSGGALGGTGVVAATTINNGGALAPGNSIGTLSVSGNLTFNAGSFYTVEVSPTAADRTNVTGTATLTGATVQAVALAGSFRAQTYTILNATGGFGGTQFVGITGSSFAPGARNPHLTYDANNVYLVLDPGTLQLSPGASGNQTNVAGGINNAVLGGSTPPAGFDVLLNMTGSQQGNALNQVSGQPGASGTQASFGAMQQFLAMLGGSGGGNEGGVTSFAAADEALGYAATAKRDAKLRKALASEAYAAVTPRDRRTDRFDHPWGVWATGYGGSSTVNGNATSGTSTTTSRVYGTVVGADYRVTPGTLFGFALGGAGFNFSLADGLGGGSADLFQFGLYGRHRFGAAYVSASFAYGWQDVTTDRTVTVSGTDKLTANYKASTFAARGEAGWRFAPSTAVGVGVTPYAALQVTSFRLPGYSETATSGSNTFALSYDAQTTTNWRTELGAHLDRPLLTHDGLFTLRGRVAWAHDSNTDRPVTAAFQTLPGSTFTVNGAKPAADAALISAGAKMDWLNGFSLAGSFEGEFSSTTRSYAGKATLRYDW